MKLMEPHLHMEGLSQESLQNLRMTGVEEIITMLALPDEVPSQPDYDPSSIFSYVDRIQNFYGWNTKKYFMIQTYSCVCVSMVSIPTRYQQALDMLHTYLQNNPHIVGIGEIGLEPTSEACPDLKIQEYVLERQLEMARELDKTVCFHTPLFEKDKWLQRYAELIRNSGLAPDRVVIDHCNNTIVRQVTDLGYYASISIQPHRHVRPIEAANMILTGDSDRIFVDSDAAFTNETDVLAVPKTAFELLRKGKDEAFVEKVLYTNPHKAYRIPCKGPQ